MERNIGISKMRNGKLRLSEETQTLLKTRPGQYILMQPREDELVMMKMDESSIPIRSDYYEQLEREARLQDMDVVELLDSILQDFLMDQH